MSEKVRICKNHGELTISDVRIFTYQGYTCTQCKFCNKEADKKKKLNPEHRAKELARSRRPENKEKARIRAEKYKERRRIVSRNRHQKMKTDEEYKKKINEWSKKKYQRMKKAFNDNYIKKILKVYKNATSEMIENKKKEILEFRRLRTEIKQQREILATSKKEIELYKNMHGIVKVCSIHGYLTKDSVYLCRNGKKSINKIYICKTCDKEQRDKYYKNNKNIIRKRQKIYISLNKEKIKNRAKQWHSELFDKYVIRLLIQKTEIKPAYISKELIELKKSSLMLKRKIRERNKLLKKGLN